MKTPMTTAEFDRRFDEGLDLADAVDWSKVRRPGLETKRVYLTLPLWAIEKLDRQARLRGIPRSSLVNEWVSEKLETVS
ncbi:MAG: hypothetical protein OXH90_10685 [Paracoccaceae bacterium]|nr:hypothetical protein [Paracoccaceae bacterium]